jgi:hypothetical protein
MREHPSLQTPEIALQSAETLVNAGALTEEPDDIERIEGRLEALMESSDSFRTPRIALARAEVLFNACVDSDDAEGFERMAQRIDALIGSGAEFTTPAIAVEAFKAWTFTYLYSETGAQRERSLARTHDWIHVIAACDAARGDAVDFLDRALATLAEDAELPALQALRARLARA